MKLALSSAALLAALSATPTLVSAAPPQPSAAGVIAPGIETAAKKKQKRGSKKPAKARKARAGAGRK